MAGISQIQGSAGWKSSLLGRLRTLEGQFNVSTGRTGRMSQSGFSSAGRCDATARLLPCHCSPQEMPNLLLQHPSAHQHHALHLRAPLSSTAPGAAPHTLLHGHPGFRLGIKKSVQIHQYENAGRTEPQQDESISCCSGKMPMQQWESS